VKYRDEVIFMPAGGLLRSVDGNPGNSVSVGAAVSLISFVSTLRPDVVYANAASIDATGQLTKEGACLTSPYAGTRFAALNSGRVMTCASLLFVSSSGSGMTVFFTACAAFGVGLTVFFCHSEPCGFAGLIPTGPGGLAVPR
jgi:hypothetical protein